MDADRKPVLLIIIGSTRPGRIGKPIGDWFEQQALEHGGFDVRVGDLAEINLPFLDEPNHPARREYTKPHTFAWSEMVDAADAYVLVLPEYNHSFTAPIKNAIDFVSKEWAYKPVGIVSYGGISGGLRAVQAIKPVLMALRMSVINEAVVIHGAGNLVHDGDFTANEAMEHASKSILNELARLAPVLQQLR